MGRASPFSDKMHVNGAPILDILNGAIFKEAFNASDSANRSESLAYIVGITERSQHLSAGASRGATYHVFAGGAIALIGILFFAYYLRLDLAQMSDHLRILASVPGIERLFAAYITGVLIQRLSVLISIEVLAGFFLRQYRIALEDFRYYETINSSTQGSSDCISRPHGFPR